MTYDASTKTCLCPTGNNAVAGCFDRSINVAKLEAEYDVTIDTAAYTLNYYDMRAALRTATVESLHYAENLVDAASDCLNYGNRTRCNHLANMCVLTMYDTTSAACKLYEGIVDDRKAIEYHSGDGEMNDQSPVGWSRRCRGSSTPPAPITSTAPTSASPSPSIRPPTARRTSPTWCSCFPSRPSLGVARIQDGGKDAAALRWAKRRTFRRGNASVPTTTTTAPCPWRTPWTPRAGSACPPRVRRSSSTCTSRTSAGRWRLRTPGRSDCIPCPSRCPTSPSTRTIARTTTCTSAASS